MTTEQHRIVREAFVWDIAALVGVWSYWMNGGWGVFLTISVWTLIDALVFRRAA